MDATKEQTEQKPGGLPVPRVRYVEAMPNEIFPPQLTALIRFALGEEPIVCVECGKASRKLWTMLAPFHATQPSAFVLKKGPERAPLELVCADHPLVPAERIAQVLADDKAPWPWEAEGEKDEDE